MNKHTIKGVVVFKPKDSVFGGYIEYMVGQTNIINVLSEYEGEYISMTVEKA